MKNRGISVLIQSAITIVVLLGGTLAWASVDIAPTTLVFNNQSTTNPSAAKTVTLNFESAVTLSSPRVCGCESEIRNGAAVR